MKSRFLFVFSICLLMTIAANAQEDWSPEQLIGISDTKRMQKLRYDYQDMCDYLDRRNYKEAYPKWRELIRVAPLLSIKYLYVEPRNMFKSLITYEEDPGQRFEYYKEMMYMYKARLANFDSLYICHPQSDSSKIQTKGEIMAMCEYDRDSLTAHVNVFESAKDKKPSDDVTCNRLRNTITYIRQNGGRLEQYGKIVEVFSKLSDEIYQKSKDSYMAQFMDDQTQCMQLSDSLLEEGRRIQHSLFGEKNARMEQIIGYYSYIHDNAKSRLEKQLNEICDSDMNEVFRPVVEKNIDDWKVLNNLLVTLNLAERNTLDVYYDIADRVNQLHPTIESCMALGQKNLDALENEQARDWFDKALEYASTDSMKAQKALVIGNIMRKKEQFSVASRYYKKAMEWDPVQEGKCHYYIGLLHKNKSEYIYVHDIKPLGTMSNEKILKAAQGAYGQRQMHLNEALECFLLAKDCDASLEYQADNQYKVVLNTKSIVEEKLKKLNKLPKAEDDYARRKAEYDAAMKKQQEEEDFWNKGKQ